jgi:hypothetical protein
MSTTRHTFGSTLRLGGYLLTGDDEIVACARSFRSHCQPAHPAGYPPQLEHDYRLAEPLAVIARANLARSMSRVPWNFGGGPVTVRPRCWSDCGVRV